MVPGHQVVGEVIKLGKGSNKYKKGDRVGVGWIYSSCGECIYCLSGNDNLCPDFKATGRDVNGGSLIRSLILKLLLFFAPEQSDIVP